MEAIPRISRAQSMDALSSQSNVAGYKAALLGAEHATRFYPMLMTAAGTIPPAKVLVLGAGVAGLQALATAKRLGAQTTGYDVRPEVAEQVQSLGANWLDLGIEAVGEGGYARDADRGGARRAAAGADRRDQGVRRRHHDRARARPPGADARHRRGRRRDEAGLRDRRPGRRDGRQLRAHRARRGRGPRRRHDRLAAQPARHDARARQPALRAQRPGAARADARRRGAATWTSRTRSSPAPASRATARSSTRAPARPWSAPGTGCAPHQNLAILVLAGFIGFLVISKVPNTLHTPLMSGTNAIHGIVVLGGIIVLGLGVDGDFRKLLLVIAIAFGTINVVGGFLVTDRMLEMFKGKPKAGSETDPIWPTRSCRTTRLHRGPVHRRLRFFIYGLMGLTGPRTAVRGNRIAAVGMAIAVIATLLIPGMRQLGPDRARHRHRHRVGVPPRAQVKMTAMPQMVALFNGVGGGAVALIAWAEFRETGGYADEAHLRRDLQPLLGDRRLGLVLGLEHRLRQAAGDPARRPITDRAPADRQPRAARRSRSAPVAIVAGPRRRVADDRPARARGRARQLMVLPIGGADMPVVISLLNAFTGLSPPRAGIALEQHRADRRGHDRRRLRLDPDAAHGQGHEPLDPVDRRRRRSAAWSSKVPAARRGDRPVRSTTRRRRGPDRLRQPGRDRAGLRHGRRPGPARRARDDQELEEPGRGQVRHPPGRGPHARAHERAAGRGRRARTTSSRRWTRSTASSRGRTSRWSSAPTTSPTPTRATRADSPIYGMPILNVDERAGDHRAQALDALGLRGSDNPLFLRAEDRDAVRRRAASVSAIWGSGARWLSSRSWPPSFRTAAASRSPPWRRYGGSKPYHTRFSLADRRGGFRRNHHSRRK